MDFNLLDAKDKNFYCDILSVRYWKIPTNLTTTSTRDKVYRIYSKTETNLTD